MLNKPKRRISARARRTIGVVASIAVTASALALPTFNANAEVAPSWAASAGYDKLPALPKQAKRSSVPFKKLPNDAKSDDAEATRGPSKPGARAKPFAKTTASARLAAGAAVNATDYPGVVAIQTRYLGVVGDGELEWKVKTCTGTVLSPTRVLTAGQCTVDVPHGFTQVIAGRNNLKDDTSGFVARVASTWTHQGFNYLQWAADGIQPVNDVTVLTLKTPLPEEYAPVRLVDQGAADPAGDTDAEVVGYGVVKMDDGTEEAILRAVKVTTATDATCGSDPQNGSAFKPAEMMCAGQPPVVDTCRGYVGGPLFTGGASSRVQVGITDWDDQDCAETYGVYAALNHYSATVKQQAVQPGTNNLDFTGDGHSDLIGRYKDTGDLLLASGTGFTSGGMWAINGFDPIGEDWGRYTKLFRVNNWDGNGNPSIFARDAQGNLFNYRGDGAGKFAGDPVQIGNGWNMFTDIMVTNNWTGNGMPNLMGRTPDGKLRMYTSNGAGGWSNPKGTQIGEGWNMFNTVLTPGSWLGDGHQSLIGRTPDGYLRLYNSDGAGGWVNPKGTQIGNGWEAFSTFMSPGDFNGDNLVDLIGVVKSNGDLKMYTTDGHGAWLNKRGSVIDVEWNDFNMVF